MNPVIADISKKGADYGAGKDYFKGSNHHPGFGSP